MTDEDEVEEPQKQKGIDEPKRLVRAIRWRLTNKLDAPVAITGYPGVGKSTLAIQLCRELDPKFDLVRNVLYDPDPKKAHEKLFGLPAGSGVIFDEAMRLAYRRRWYSNTNIRMNEIYAVCRKQFKASFFCLPSFSKLDADLQERILFWIHIPVRGYAVVMKKEENPFSPDCWNLKENYRLFREFVGKIKVLEADLGVFLTAMSKTKNFVGVIRYDRLSEEVEAQYEALVQPYAFEDLEKVEKGRVLLYRTGLKLCLSELVKAGWKVDDLVRLTGLPKSTVNDFLKESGVRPVDFKARKVGMAERFFLNE